MTDPKHDGADESTGSSQTNPSSEPKPLLWERLPRYVKGTRIRTSTAILVVLFVALLFWYLNLRAQFVPEEQRRTGQTVVQTTTAPPTPESYAPRSSVPASSSAVPSSGAAASTGQSGSAGPSASAGESGGADPSVTSPEGQATSPRGAGGASTADPSIPTSQEPGVGGAPTTTAPPS